MLRTRVNACIIDLHCRALSQVVFELDTLHQPEKRTFGTESLTSTILRWKVAQSTKKYLVKHGLDIDARLRIFSLIARIILTISVVRTEIITAVSIIRIIWVPRIVWLDVLQAIWSCILFRQTRLKWRYFPQWWQLNFFWPPCSRSGWISNHFFLVSQLESLSEWCSICGWDLASCLDSYFRIVPH